jgi:hypothetical protein
VSSPIVLNVVWGFIAFTAVLLYALAERKHWCVKGRGGRVQRISAVLIAVCFLFPCVSASDDILGLSTVGHKHTGTCSHGKNLIHLERVLQELESLQVSASYIYVVALCCVGSIQVSRLRSVARQIPCSIGRGPPSFA